MRWAIAGHGDVVEGRAIAAMRVCGHDIAAVWGRDRERVGAFAARHGIGVASTSFTDVLKHADAVYVATPVAAHVPLAVAAARAGRHALIEKPLTGGIASSRELVDVPACVRMGVGYYRRLWPQLVELRALVRSAATPPRVSVRFRCSFDVHPDHPMYWRTQINVAGAGVLADAGSHRIDLLVWMLGAPKSVNAQLSRRFSGGCERLALLILRWANGARANCHFEWNDGPREDRFDVYLDDHLVSLDLGALDPPQNTHVALVDDFAKAVRVGRDPVCPIRDAEVTDRVIAAALTRNP